MLCLTRLAFPEASLTPYLRRAQQIQPALTFDGVPQASGKVFGPGSTALNRGGDRGLVAATPSRSDGGVEDYISPFNTDHDDGFERIVLGVETPAAGYPLKFHRFQPRGNFIR